jgi:uncharacterized protein (DUF1800 family)
MQRRQGTLALMCCAAAMLVPAALQAQSITISPGYTTVGVNGTVQYTATVTGLANTAVTWSVSGVKGGNSTYGTITTGGLYTAPAKIPTAGITISALGSDKKTSAVEYVAVEPAGPPISKISPSPIPVGSYNVTITGTGFVSGATARTPGVNLSTTFVNSTTLTASGYQGTVGSLTFQVMNPTSLWGAGFTAQFVAPQTISPTPVSVKLGATQQFTSSGATSWTASAGTISTAGLYTAPATMPSSSSVTVTAKGPGGSASAAVTLVSTQAIDPKTVSVKLGATQQFTSSGATSWTASAGTISTAGLYTAPTTMPSSSSVTVKATGPGGSASAAVTLTNAPAISPTSVSLKLGATQQFTSSGATSWTASAGTISTAGLYTAPTSMPSSSSVTVTATGSGGSASAIVTLVNPQAISPTAVSVKLGATQQFTSAGATGWSASAGTISTDGLYTAPSSMPSSSSVTVTATGPGGSASAAVTLTNGQTISPAAASVNLGAAQQFTSSGATAWAAAYGTVTAAGLYTAPAAMSSTGTDAVTATGPNGNATATVTLIPPTPVITAVGSNGQLPLGIFSAAISGSGFIPSSVASLNGTPLGTTFSSSSTLTATGFSSLSGAGNITVRNGSLTSQPFAVEIGVPNAQVSSAAARRFLEQAAFGPTPNDAANVQTLGFQGWLTQQFNMAQVSNYSSITSDQSGMPALFLTNAVTNPDQLRQRVAFALSQIFVTSIQKLIWNQNMILFQDMLLADAFSNFSQIMSDVTLSPAMGQYLDMANNAMADPSTGALANENYARELMQLFTIGTQMLNPDGSVQLDVNSLPIPTYSQFNITEFARVYTGWTYAPAAGDPVEWGAYITSNGPMVPYPAEHDSGSKQLLNYPSAPLTVSPAGITPLQDLNNALTNVFNHPNVGPFVSKLLIQHLVKSNPSPAYISRVAAAFNSNSQGARGDMTAVITAILLDPEARANDNGGNDQPTDGHLQEPGLFIAGMVRAFGGQMTSANYFPYDMANMSQDIFNAPSVFNYYSPTYGVPGTTLLGPEFEIHTPNNAVYRANVVQNLFSQWSNPVQSYGPGTTVDLTAFLPLAATPATLVSALDLTLTHGVMPSAMKTAIVNTVTNDTYGPLHQVETACYLILTSSYYNVWH